MWQTNATALRAGGEAMLIDSPYFPDELEALPALLAQAGFEPDALLATHADFDHLLGPARVPRARARAWASRPRCGCAREPGAAQRELRDNDAEHYVERPAPLALGHVQALPVPGQLELGDEELELHPAEGHTADGMAVFARWCGRAVRGRLPLRRGDPDDRTAARSTTTARRSRAWRRWWRRPRRSCPATARRTTATTRCGILDEDVDYLDALERGEEARAARGPRHARAAGDPRPEPEGAERGPRPLSRPRLGFGCTGQRMSNAPDSPRRRRTAAAGGRCRAGSA